MDSLFGRVIAVMFVPFEYFVWLDDIEILQSSLGEFQIIQHLFEFGFVFGLGSGSESVLHK